MVLISISCIFSSSTVFFYKMGQPERYAVFQIQHSCAMPIICCIIYSSFLNQMPLFLHLFVCLHSGTQERLRRQQYWQGFSRIAAAENTKLCIQTGLSPPIALAFYTAQWNPLLASMCLLNVNRETYIKEVRFPFIFKRTAGE